MEEPSHQRNVFKQESPKRKKGGFITIPFIIANEALEKVASLGLLPNMIMYLIREYRMEFTEGQNILFFWSAATNFLPLVGAFLSDSFLGRFSTIALGSTFSFLGMFILWLTAMIPQAKPGPCNLQDHPCKSTSTPQYLLLLSAFIVMSIGAGGTRPCSLAFGADQIDNKDNPMNERILERFFGWYYASAAVAVVLAFTGIVYIQDHFGWKLGFGIPALLMFLSTVFFLLASSLYIKPKVKMNLFSSFVQVISLCYKKRKLTFPSPDSIKWYSLKDSERLVPTDKLRFMNKACVIWNSEEIGPDGVASNPCNICTVDQVEELKTLIRVLPLWSAAIMMSVNISTQSSFVLLQAKSMDRHLAGGLEIPAASFVIFTIATIFTWIMLYDRILVPLASKIRGKPVHLDTKVRMGIGLFCSFMSMVVAAIVEHIRRRKAIQQGLSDNPSGLVVMSAYWLVPQHVLGGLAEAFNSIAQTEFYYSEFPKSMSSIASAMFGLGMAFANLLGSAILNTVNHVTSEGGKVSWTSTNINKGHYESYYWLLAILSAVNLFYFLVCSWAYGPCAEQRNGVRRDNKKSYGSSEEEMLRFIKPPEKNDRVNVGEIPESRSALPELLNVQYSLAGENRSA
ncbi:hypothetical protein DCAR_0518553 [Daucus carota subsp. sativus]|uniref:Major facilitator superfamily (MFS) profile domain-containing protein n=1 Tax=Daucus carota subsp. sativus TaxID=79200 RepID=A0A161ZXK9_DAUCS|nr:PREDICTED: protein NRT1/ PTR FAMILY 1.1-like [Daucus carota subsp. sativus]WOG99205.1 hypothetical protein DCAR_0518553 [Daucus carota subsp. sativus]